MLFCLQVKWSGVRTQHSTTPFIDEVYDRLRETLNDYEVIICRWPEYVFVLEEVCFNSVLILSFSSSYRGLIIFKREREYKTLLILWVLRFYKQAIADVEKAIVEALDKQYADVLSPLKENLAPKKFGLKYVQKLAKRSVCAYTVPDEVCHNFTNFLGSFRWAYFLF